MGPKFLNFQSFDLYKGKNISRCSLDLEHSKNIYFSYVISIYLEDIRPLFLILCEIYQNTVYITEHETGGCL